MILSSIAEQYVRLVLKLGLYDEDFVDAYYGPDEWKPTGSKHSSFPAEEFLHRTASLAITLQNVALAADEEERLRCRSLAKQIIALDARVRFLSGTGFSFDEESRLLYDAVAPHNDEAHFRRLLSSLDGLLPGTGSVHERLDSFRKSFVIPVDRLDAVFSAATTEGRRRTLEYIALPKEERFTVEYVTGKAWSGYNWYKGNCFSIIQVNTDFPILIDRAVDLACHEGYPGHHVFNMLMETNLVRRRKWMEFSVYPLFSPLSLIAEGSANFGIEMALPEKDRIDFERKTLFPLAGLDAARTEEYYAVQKLITKLHYAGNEAARGYLDGVLNKDAAVEWLVTYALFEPKRAVQRIGFFEKYRSYVINYNLGLDLVRASIEKRGGTIDNPSLRWKLFEELLSLPPTPGSLR
ncbi:MAG: hypothetical protein NTV54_09525 [Ignavibacteriales bacterium]|nr:hypothetical protein [Ignavibacteriales bacterium]